MRGGPTQEWNAYVHSRGYDDTSRVSGDMPSAAYIIGWAMALLSTKSAVAAVAAKTE